MVMGVAARAYPMFLLAPEPGGWPERVQFWGLVLGVPVVRPAVTETTALGAAYLAGLAVGFWPSVDAITGQWRVDRRFEPSMSPGRATALRERWSAALARAKGWESQTSE